MSACDLLVVGAGPAGHSAATAYRTAGGTGAMVLLPGAEHDGVRLLRTSAPRLLAWGDGYATVRLVDHRQGAFTAWYADAKGTCVGVLTHDRDPDYETGQRLIAQGASAS